MVFGTFGFAWAEDVENIAPMEEVELLEEVESGFDLQYFLDYARNLRRGDQPSIEDMIIPDHKFDDNAVQYQPDDEVRFIVEVDGTPLVKKEGIVVSGNEGLLMAKQEQVIQDLEALDSNIEVRHRFVQGLNGFSISSKYKNLGEIKKMPDVVEVHVVRRYELDMQYSVPIINLQETWDSKVKGEGTLIAILDTGIDWQHQDFQKVPASPKFTDAEMTEKLRSTEENDIVFNSKVITGWDFADKDNDVIPNLDQPFGHDHGVHVAGTAAANGQIVGVAPEAQLLAVKVFSCTDQAWAYTDDIVAGIIYSVNLGADVINMSLGSTAAFVDPDGPYEDAIGLAKDAGIVVAVSAGNSNISTAPIMPLAINPDIGLVGSPSLTSGAFSVASFENTHVTAFTIELGDGTQAVFAPGGINPLDVLNNSTAYAYEYAGLGGDASYFAHADFNRKVALIMRGVYPFTQKILAAQDAGAIAVIVFNDAARGDALVNMATDPAITIPSLFIGNTDGMNMHDEVANRTVIFSGEVVSQPNPDAGKMSGFTSWGLTPNLDFKPEITAPGGNIWSTMTGNKYASMSGTSMAAPHVAGASALVLQVLNERGYTGLTRAEMAQKLMMNTATPITVTDAVYQESPRRQGAGLLNVDAALKTPAIVTFAEDASAGISLREIGDSKDFALNLSTFDIPSTVTYNVYTSILTNKINGEFLSMSMTNVDGALMTVNGTTVTDEVYSTITIAKNSTLSLNFNLNLVGATGLNDNAFVEGFIRLVPTDSTLPELSIPFVGFYGDWDGPSAPSVVDRAHFEADAFLPYTGLYEYWHVERAEAWELPLDIFVDAEWIQPLGADAAFSPNNDWMLDSVSAGFTLLRNAKTFRMFVEDSEGNTVKDVFDNRTFEVNGVIPFEEGLRKTVLARGAWVEYSTSQFSWKGLNNTGVIAEDGIYNIVLESKVDFPTATPQRQVMPIMLDTTAPTVSGITVTEVTPNEEYTISWTSNDTLSGVDWRDVFVEGIHIGSTGDSDSISYLGETPVSVVVVVSDRAWNQAITYIGAPVIQADAFTANVSGDFVSYLRPVSLEVILDRTSTVEIEILDPQGSVIYAFQPFLMQAPWWTYWVEWAPTEFAQSGTYTARFTATDAEGGTSVVETEFEVYNYDTRIANVEIQTLDGTVVDSVVRGDTVIIETTVENLGPNSASPMVIVKITDASGNLTYLGTVEYENLLARETKAVKTGFTIPNFKPRGEYTVEVYVWDGWDTMNPLSSTTVIEFTVY